MKNNGLNAFADNTQFILNNKKDVLRLQDIFLSGGEEGIRTLGTRKSTTVFETAPFDHSGTSPLKGCKNTVFNN